MSWRRTYGPRPRTIAGVEVGMGDLDDSATLADPGRVTYTAGPQSGTHTIGRRAGPAWELETLVYGIDTMDLTGLARPALQVVLPDAVAIRGISDLPVPFDTLPISAGRGVALDFTVAPNLATASLALFAGGAGPVAGQFVNIVVSDDPAQLDPFITDTYPFLVPPTAMLLHLTVPIF